MLDAETKARIDSARDILVGKVPDPKSQVEQITIALDYKFMDDMDRQSEELGVKTSILFLDRNLVKRTDEVLFVKIENDGFDLGAQRRPIEKNDLLEALKAIEAWRATLCRGRESMTDATERVPPNRARRF